MKRNTRVSTAVIRRLPRYYRQLSELQESGVVRISSNALGKSMGLTASQIRQDLFCFGGFGQQGYGYKVDSLKEEIGDILGINQGHTIVATKRRKIWQVFRDIDKKKYTLEATEFAKPIIGVNKWSDLIPNFRWRSME